MMAEEDVKPELDSEEEETQVIDKPVETDEIELSDVQSLEQPETEELEESEEPETVVMIGDEEPEPKEEAPQWVKDVRKQNRELLKENKALKKQNTDSVEKINAPGKKPTLEDFDHDPDDFETALSGWYEQDAEYKQEQKKLEAQKEKEESSYKEKVKSYQKQKTELPFSDDEIEQAEQIVHDLMEVHQLGTIVTYAKNPALVFNVLGNNPKRAREISEINDPVKFAIAVANLESKLKVTKRKPATTPERTITGSGPTMTAGDKELERLRAEAAKTGDMTKVVAYRRKQKELKKQA